MAVAALRSRLREIVGAPEKRLHLGQQHGEVEGLLDESRPRPPLRAMRMFMFLRRRGKERSSALLLSLRISAHQW